MRRSPSLLSSMVEDASDTRRGFEVMYSTISLFSSCHWAISFKYAMVPFFSAPALVSRRRAYGSGPPNILTANFPSFFNCSARELVMLLTLVASIPSTAMIAPRTSDFGDVMPGRGLESWARTLILFRTGMDMTMASTPEFWS